MSLRFGAGVLTGTIFNPLKTGDCYDIQSFIHHRLTPEEKSLDFFYTRCIKLIQSHTGVWPVDEVFLPGIIHEYDEELFDWRQAGLGFILFDKE